MVALLEDEGVELKIEEKDSKSGNKEYREIFSSGLNCDVWHEDFISKMWL